MSTTAQRAPAEPRRRTPRLSWFVPQRELPKIVLGSTAAAVLAAPLYWDETLWLGAGLALAIALIWHGMLATSRVPWMPGVVVGTACLQWILAPWAAYHLPQSPTAVAMVLTPSEYFSYAVPATFALAFGLALPLRRLGRNIPPRVLGNLDRRRLQRTLDWMLLVGVAARFIVAPFAGSGFRFAVTLVAELVWVGAFGAMLIDAPGWKWRVGGVLALEGVAASAQGIFFELIVWSIYFTLLFLFTRRVRRSRMIAITLSAIFVIFALNGIKGSFREEIYGSSLTTLERGALAMGYVGGMIKEPAKVLAPENIGYNVQRLNQGSIIGRVMYWTPSREPFAGGETITTALRASLLPRFLVPDKYVAGGSANYPRFTGLTLLGATSINLSFAGELYANYGRAGGIVGMLLVGILFGSLFAVFTRWARHSVLWWAWLPYVMLMAVTAEGGIGETLNQVVKSGVVMIAVIMLVPAWQALRPQVALRQRRRELIARKA